MSEVLILYILEDQILWRFLLVKDQRGSERSSEKQNPANKCIIFIDEIDSLGYERNKQSLCKEADNTLNQLLSEMDGFEEAKGVTVIGATNQVDILDKALLRPGRFDRKIGKEFFIS